MKKFGIMAAVVVLVAFATPVFAADPFSDVPANHWAYDAVTQLSSREVVGGYPDNTFRGQQPVTRYEMASLLFRALGRIDETQASKEDLELIKKLVAEFQEELAALGRKPTTSAPSAGSMGGWKVSGWLRTTLEGWKYDAFPQSGGNPNAPLPHPAISKRGYTSVQTRLHLERWFGENDEIHLLIRMQDGQDERGDTAVVFNKFFVEFPGWGGTKVTVGRALVSFEDAYRFRTGGFTDSSNESWLINGNIAGNGGFIVEKSFGLGGIKAYLSKNNRTGYNAVGAWEVGAAANLQFNERFGFDVGGQAFIGDDTKDAGYLNSLMTVFGGFRADFTNAIALKGIYYNQTSDIEQRTTEDEHAFKVILDMKPAFLGGFTSFWLEYNQLTGGFVLPMYGRRVLMLDNSDNGHGYRWMGGNESRTSRPDLLTSKAVGADTSIIRVAGRQEWNPKWSTWVYVSQFNFSGYGLKDDSAVQYGLGVEYKYNPQIGFTLYYLGFQAGNNLVGDQSKVGVYREDNHRITFRTQVSF